MFRLPESRRPVPPGEILFHDWLEPLGFTKKSAAERLGISRPRMSELVAGKRALSSDTAMRFGKLTNTDPAFWLRLQLRVQLWDAAQDDLTALDEIEPLELQSPPLKEDRTLVRDPPPADEPFARGDDRK